MPGPQSHELQLKLSGEGAPQRNGNAPGAAARGVSVSADRSVDRRIERWVQTSPRAAHRRLREAQVIAALATGPATAAQLAARIYTEVSPGLLPAATRNVLAHLIDLASRNRVDADPSPAVDALWNLS